MQTDCQYHELRVVYQDEHLVAVHKPAALLVHRSPIDKRETRFAVQMTRDLIGQHVFPVHRLDKATSGLLLFALNKTMASLMGQQMQSRAVEKTYWALVRGWPSDCGVIDHALRYKPDRLGDPLVAKDKPEQAASTAYQCLAKASLDMSLGRFTQQRYSLLKLSPQTGRKHQLRRHMNHISHPIIGDVNYGDRHHNHLFNTWRAYHRLYLAAVKLAFTHPATGQALQLVCPLQDDFQNTLLALGINQTLASDVESSKADPGPR